VDITPKNRDILPEDWYAGYRTPLRSKMWNGEVQGVINSTLTLFAWENYTQQRQNNFIDGQVYEEQTIAAQVMKNTAQFEALAGYYEQGYKNNTSFYTNFYLSDNINELVSTQVAGGTLHLLPISTESKIDLVENMFGDLIPSDNVIISHIVLNNYSSTEPTLRNICDSNLATKWLYLSAEKVMSIIEIESPNKQSPYINTITISPAPDFAWDLTSVQYLGSTGNWEIVPAFPEENNGIPLIGSTRTFYMSDAFYNNKVRIHLQPNTTVLPNATSIEVPYYVVGLKDVWIGRTEFSKEGYTWLEFTSKFYITSIKALELVASSLDPNIIRVRLYTNKNGTPFYDNSINPYPLTQMETEILVPAFTKTIYMLINMYYTDSTPQVNSVFISYKPGEI